MGVLEEGACDWFQIIWHGRDRIFSLKIAHMIQVHPGHCMFNLECIDEEIAIA
jgi:hypothetical protein